MHPGSTLPHAPPMVRDLNADIPVGDLAEAHGRDVFKTACRVTGDPRLAEDIQQHVFVRLLEKPPTAAIDCWKSYLCAMATRAAIDELRRARRWRRLADAWLSNRPSDEPGPQATLDAGTRARTLREALGRIPKRQAECFALRFLDGLEIAEIADILSISANHVSVTLNRAVHSLRARIRTIESRPLEVNP